MVAPLVLVTAAWVLGLLAAHSWLVPYGIRPEALGLLCLVPVGALLLWPRDRAVRLGAACSLAVLLGGLRYERSLPDHTDPGLVSHYNDVGRVTVEGIVSGYPDRRDTWTWLRLDALTLDTGGTVHPVRGTVLVQTVPLPEFSYGDRLRMRGSLETPWDLDGFSYREYLERQGVYSVLRPVGVQLLASGQGSDVRAALFSLRDRLRLAVSRLVEAPESALLQGILLGIRSEIPGDLTDQFNATSTSHVLVISGANVVIVTALLSRALAPVLGMRRGTWVTLAGLAFYVLLVGAEQPVVRAGVMAGLYLAGRYLGRPSTSTVSLCAAALGLTACRPASLWDASFQLTFVATLGLVVLAFPLDAWLEQRLWQSVTPPPLRALCSQIGGAIAVTLAPQVMVLPLIALTFGRLSPVAPLANLLIAPAQPLIMSWGLVAALAGLCPWLLPLARVIAWVPWLLLAYTRTIVHWMAGWPLASVPISRAVALWLSIAIYGGLAVVGVLRLRKSGVPPSLPQASPRLLRAGAGILLLLTATLVLTIRQLPDRRLHVAFLDVGQGDAILITTPRGRQILVDGGPSPGSLFTGLGEAMPFWDHSIDLVISTHADRDHITGLLRLLERYDLGGWVDNGIGATDLIAQECQRRLALLGVKRHTAAAGERIDLGEETYLEFIHPQGAGRPGSESVDSNNSSIVALLSHGGTRFLLTGDIEAEVEQSLLRSGPSLEADVLKVPHHGSAHSSSAGFLAAVRPSYAVISVGSENLSGHPTREALEHLQAVPDLLVLRTDLQGTIEFVSDGHRLWAKTER